MSASLADAPDTTADAPWRSPDWVRRYALILSAGFTALYLITRSSLLMGDGEAFLRVAGQGRPGALHFGVVNHFLQVPLARAVWRGLGGLGVPVPLELVFVGLSVLGTIAAIVFIGLIAAEICRTRTAAWIAALLFGTSLHVWTQANGELYRLALGFTAAGIWLALRGRIYGPACLWVLAVASHIDFLLATPAFITAVAMAPRAPGQHRLRRALAFLAIGTLATTGVLALGSLALGKWSNVTSLGAWISQFGQRAFNGPRVSVLGIQIPPPQLGRALKGLLTAYTVAGHFWRDIATGRGAFEHPWFLPAAVAGLVVLILTALLIAYAALRPRTVVLALSWTVPFFILLNSWFLPTVEKYHAGALPGVVLIVTAGLVDLLGGFPERARRSVAVGYVVLCAGLNLSGAVLPIQKLGRDNADAVRQVRLLNEQQEGRAVFIACDNSRAVDRSGVKYVRLRTGWNDVVAAEQTTIRSWAEARVREGAQPYLLGRWCLPNEWYVGWSKQPFDLYFLKQSFTLTPTGIQGVPIAQFSATDPFSWMRGDVVRLDPLVGQTSAAPR